MIAMSRETLVKKTCSSNAAAYSTAKSGAACCYSCCWVIAGAVLGLLLLPEDVCLAAALLAEVPVCLRTPPGPCGLHPRVARVAGAAAGGGCWS